MLPAWSALVNETAIDGVAGVSPQATRHTHVPSATATPTSTALTAADFHSYHFVDVWGGTPEETAAKVAAFTASPQFDELAPVAEAAAVLRAHADAFSFAVVTSRQHVLEAKTRAWLDAHFPGVFSTVLFGNHYGEGEKTCVSIAEAWRRA